MEGRSFENFYLIQLYPLQHIIVSLTSTTSHLHLQLNRFPISWLPLFPLFLYLAYCRQAVFILHSIVTMTTSVFFHVLGSLIQEANHEYLC